MSRRVLEQNLPHLDKSREERHLAERVASPRDPNANAQQDRPCELVSLAPIESRKTLLPPRMARRHAEHSVGDTTTHMHGIGRRTNKKNTPMLGRLGTSRGESLQIRATELYHNVTQRK